MKKTLEKKDLDHLTEHGQERLSAIFNGVVAVTIPWMLEFLLEEQKILYAIDFPERGGCIVHSNRRPHYFANLFDALWYLTARELNRNMQSGKVILVKKNSKNRWRDLDNIRKTSAQLRGREAKYIEHE